MRSRPIPRAGTAWACAAISRARSRSTRTIPKDRLVGPIGDGASSNDECVDPFFLLCSSACWNGISMALIDIAKRHTTGKTHKDVGMRVADYPTIQDYVGEAIIDTNSCRAFNFLMAQAMDGVTNNCDWSIHKDLEGAAARPVPAWMWQVKFAAAKNVAHVTDKMLHACGGTGYKPRPLEIERYLRDGKAGWVMGPTNEVLRQFVGKAALLGFGALDYWNQSINERVLNNEIKKMSAAEKQALAEKLLGEARRRRSNAREPSPRSHCRHGRADPAILLRHDRRRVRLRFCPYTASGSKDGRVEPGHDGASYDFTRIFCGS